MVLVLRYHNSQVLFANNLILFSKATDEQAYVVKESMEVFLPNFWWASLEKSNIFCSKNTNTGHGQSIANIFGSPMVKNLGKYLGILLIHSKASHNTYNGVIENMKNRLASWKGWFMSTAGRSILIKSVMGSLPIYAMNTIQLGSTMCRDIDKIHRHFFMVEQYRPKICTSF